MIPSLRNLVFHPHLQRLAVLCVLWLMLTEGIPGSWIIGLPVIAAIFIMQQRRQESTEPLSVSPGGALAYVPFFLWQSVKSGFEVAARAWRPEMYLHPGVAFYTVRLPAGAARRLFINSITLMPGTLSVTEVDDTVHIHLLDEMQPHTQALQRLERLVAALYGIRLENLEKG